MDEVQHEKSWSRIQEIEAPKESIPETEQLPKQPPKFTSPIQNNGASGLFENQPFHLETTVEPIDDPELTIQVYNKSFFFFYKFF